MRRLVKNQHNLDQHKRTHLPRIYACPVPGCAVRRATYTDVVLHIVAKPHESMTRIEFDEYIINSALRPLVVAGGRIVRRKRGLYQRKDPIDTVEDWEADNHWNGGCYECPHCDLTFPARQSILAHLRSPAHDDRIYKCKDSGEWDGCGDVYPTLGALLQHVRSGCRSTEDRKAIYERLISALDELSNFA